MSEKANVEVGRWYAEQLPSVLSCEVSYHGADGNTIMPPDDISIFVYDELLEDVVGIPSLMALFREHVRKLPTDLTMSVAQAEDATFPLGIEQYHELMREIERLRRFGEYLLAEAGNLERNITNRELRLTASQAHASRGYPRALD